MLSNLARFSAEEGEDDVDSNVEYEDGVFGDEIDDMNEKYELHSNTVLEVITVNGATALFSSSTSLELFYLWKVLSFGNAEQDLKDENNHCIEKGDTYIEVKYFKVKSNNFKKPTIVYKCLPKPAFIHPAQVMSPKVNVTYIGSDIHVSREEYQWLCDSI